MFTSDIAFSSILSLVSKLYQPHKMRVYLVFLVSVRIYVRLDQEILKFLVKTHLLKCIGLCVYVCVCVCVCVFVGTCVPLCTFCVKEFIILFMGGKFSMCHSESAQGFVCVLLLSNPTKLHEQRNIYFPQQCKTKGKLPSSV